MNDLLTRRPDRPLPPGRHEALRADLLAAIDTEETRTPHRELVPLIAAAAVLAVVVGLAIGVPALERDDGAAPAAGQDQAQPRTRELSAGDTKKLRGSVRPSDHDRPAPPSVPGLHDAPGVRVRRRDRTQGDQVLVDRQR